MAGLIGEPSPQPWNFGTTNVRMMLSEATEIAFLAVPGSDGVTEAELLIAVNNCRHAADELERSWLEMKFGARH